MRASLRLFVLTSLCLFAGAACNATFDVHVSSKSTVKSGGLFQNLVGSTFGDFSSLDLSQTSDFKNAGVTKNEVDSVKLSKATLKIDSPQGATFEFLDDISFFVETEGQPRQKIAEAKNIPNDATNVDLTVFPVELKPYVTAPKMSVTTESTAHAPQNDTTIEAGLTFTVDPKIL
jgi:hypothetical protein